MIEFGDWQVRRSDPLNLTLYHRHEKSRAGKGERSVKGEVGWCPTGNYFHSVGNAVMFALRRDVRDAVGDESEAMTMAEYVAKVERLVDDYEIWLSASLSSS